MLGPAYSNDRSRMRPARSGSFPFAAGDGSGYVFAIGSSSPLDFRAMGPGGQWRGARGARRVDPFETVDRFARGIARRGTYSIAYAPYSVAGRYRDERRRAVGVGAVRRRLRRRTTITTLTTTTPTSGALRHTGAPTTGTRITRTTRTRGRGTTGTVPTGRSCHTR